MIRKDNNLFGIILNKTHNFFDAVKFAELVDEELEFSGVVDIDGDVGFHEVLLRFHLERVQIELQLVGEQIGHLVEQPDAVDGGDL